MADDDYMKEEVRDVVLALMWITFKRLSWFSILIGVGFIMGWTVGLMGLL